MSFQEELKEILDAALADYGAYWAGKSHYDPETKFLKPEEALTEIMELVKSVVPNENIFDYDSKKKLHHRWEGFNACRKKILKRLEATPSKPSKEE